MTSRHIKPEYYKFFEIYPLLYHHHKGAELTIRNIAVGIKLDEKRDGHDIIERANKKIKGFKKLEGRLNKNGIFPYASVQLKQISDTAERIKGNILEHYRSVRSRGRNDLEKSYVQIEEDQLVLLMAEGAYILYSLTEDVRKHYRGKLNSHRKKMQEKRGVGAKLLDDLLNL